MPTDQPFTPTGACAGSCNHRNRATWAAHQRAIDDHADAIDTWFRNGQHGEPPAEPEQPTIYWKPGNPLFCDRDLAAARRSLLELDTQAAQLLATSDGHRARVGGGGDGRVTGSKGAPSPSPAADVHDALVGWLFDTEDNWREACGYAPRTTGQRGPRGAHPRSASIAWLADHLPAMLAHPDMIELPATIYRWEKVLRHLTKDDRATGSSKIRCPRSTCGERRVTWDDERHYYTCQACGNIIYEGEHDQHERDQADAADLTRSAMALPPAVQHRTLVPRPADDAETRTAGTLPVVESIRIDPDTMRLVFRAPYNRPLTEAEFPGLPWPPCPRCGGRIDVEHVAVERAGKAEALVGARVLPAIEPERHALPGRWQCAGRAGEAPCGAEGSA